jgi:hypothetical protein
LTGTPFPPLYAADGLALLAALRNKQGRAHEAAAVAGKCGRGVSKSQARPV